MWNVNKNWTLSHVVFLDFGNLKIPFSPEHQSLVDSFYLSKIIGKYLYDENLTDQLEQLQRQFKKPFPHQKCNFFQ